MTLVVVPPLQRPPARPRGTHRVQLHGCGLGTGWSLTAHVPPDCLPQTLRQVVVAELAAVTAEMSGWAPESQLCRFNRGVPGSWHRFSSGHFGVLQAALRIAAATGGAFDPCLGAAVDRWGFGPSGPVAVPPDPASSCAAAAFGRRAGAGWQDLLLDLPRQAVRQPGGVTLDLSAIGKGHAVDRVCEAVRALGVASLLVEIGGELRGEGGKPDGSPWWVGLEEVPVPADSRRDRGPGHECRREGGAIVALHGQAIATSGDYRRHFWHAGRRYGHVLDPATQHPAQTDIAAVSVLARDCMQADAFATALASQEAAAALAMADDLGLAAFLRLRDGGVRCSAALAAML